MEMPCPCLGTSTTEREEKIGVLIWDILPPVHLLTPDCGPLPASIYDLYNQVKFLKLQLHPISKDPVTIVILLGKKTSPCKFLINNLFCFSVFLAVSPSLWDCSSLTGD